MSKLIIAILLFIVAINVGKACKIQIKVRSLTQNKFKIQVYIPSIKQKTERMLFTAKEEKKVRVSYLYYLSNDFLIFLIKILQTLVVRNFIICLCYRFFLYFNNFKQKINKAALRN